jgi:hypothetical protein
LANFERNLKTLLSSGTVAKTADPAPYPQVKAEVLSGGQAFAVAPGTKIYSDNDAVMSGVAPELRGLTGIRIPLAAAVKDGVKIEVNLPEPAQELIGFFRSEKKNGAAAPPKDEWEPILRNGIVAKGEAGFTVWSHALPAGRNILDFGKGGYVVLGFIKRDAQPEPRMVFFGDAGQSPANLDWLFEQ